MRFLDRGVEHRLGVRESSLLGERVGGVQAEPRALRMPGREQGGGSAQQVGRRRDVAPSERTPAGGREVAGSTDADLPDLLIVRRELLQREERLLEVIAPDLLELEDAIRRDALEPVDEPDVELRAGPLQESVVRGLSD